MRISDWSSDVCSSDLVKRFHGVGPVTAARMARLGIETGADLRAQSLAWLEAHFGRSGGYYHRAARGEDDRPVRADRPYKSVGAERTFATALLEAAALSAESARIAGYAWARVARAEVSGRTGSSEGRRVGEEG